MGRLDGKVAVITGSSGGIGGATAERFVAEGAIVVGVDVAGDADYNVDVTDEDAVRALYASVRERYGRIDVLFNNAGISPNDDASALETGLDAWRRVQDVNLTSVFLCCKHGIPHLLETGGGSVINTASFVAVVGAATSQISYTASKGGVLALSRELGVEFAKRGVRVNALCPGAVDTPLLRELYATGPRGGGPAPHPRAHGPLRPRQRAGQRRPVPRLRRGVLRDRDHVHGRRRDQRRVRDAALTSAPITSESSSSSGCQSTPRTNPSSASIASTRPSRLAHPVARRPGATSRTPWWW